MLQPGRHQNTGDYRYAFAGMELDNELKGEGNSYDFGARMYDSRVGRWFAEDPLAIQYPMYSPYGYAANSPLVVLDSDGESIIFWIFKKMGLTTKEAALQAIDGWGVRDQQTRNFILFVAGMASGAADMNIVDAGKGMIMDANQIAIGIKTINNLIDLDWDEAKFDDVATALVSATPVEGMVAPFTELYKDFTEEGRDIDFFESGRNTIIAGTTIVTTMEGVSSALTKPKVKVGGTSSTAINTSSFVNQINSIRNSLNIGKTRNIGYLEGMVDGKSYSGIGISGKATRKGTVGNPSNRLFKTKEVGGYDRLFDSEVKLLEDFAQKYKDTPNVKGTLQLVSERPFCSSCSGVVKQFKEMFPNVELQTVDGVK